MAGKKVDPLAAKQKKQKIFLAVGGLLFVGLMFMQLPKLMGGSKSSATPEPIVMTNADGTVAPPATAGGTPVAATATGLPEGTFRSFEVYGGAKNPFRPQVGEATQDSPGAAAGGTSGSEASSSAGSTSPPSEDPAPEAPAAPVTPVDPPTDPVVSSPPATTGPTTPASGSGSASGSGPAAVPNGATVRIAVNGRVESLDRLAAFPKADPVFRLAVVKPGLAKIGVVGGSYTAGGELLTLHKGKPVTLLDTSTGKRYRLQLLAAR